MKTIFITSFHPLISRNILQTKFLELITVEHRVVLLVPDFKKEFFEREFKRRNLIVEGVNITLKRGDLFFRKLALILCPSKTLTIKIRAEAWARRNPFAFFGYLIVSRIFGKRAAVLKLARAADYFFHRPGRFKELFEKYKPDLVFGTDVQNELDVRLLDESKRRGVRSVGMVRSWDNLTAKGILRFFPARLLVSTEIVKSEARRLNGFPGDRISVIGIPHYDRYFKAIKSGDFLSSREEFFKPFDFDSKKKLILFAPAGKRYLGHARTDKYALQDLTDLDVNILVRIPPGDTSDFEGFQSKRARVAFDYSGVSFWKGGRKLNELSEADDRRLMNLLYWSDAVVAHIATICIDAAFFDKPTVVIGFDPEPRPYLSSIKKYFDYDHLQPIIKSGGVKIAKSSGELLLLVTRYLQNPKIDAEGRKRIVREQVHFTDGKSGARLADLLLKS